MAKRLKKAVKIGKQLASAAGKRVKKEAKALVAAGIIDKKEAKKLLKTITNELRAEAARVARFAKQEITREMQKTRKKVKPVIRRTVKGAIARWQKARKR